ncbi:MAG: FlgO family outer membrane protein [Cyclobacteriaceae bacterium]
MRSLLPLLTFCLLLSGPSLAQKSKTQAKVVDDLVENLGASKLNKQPISLAIVPFTSAVPSKDPKNTFGEYLTELMIGKVSENTGKFKLFERSRLDAIFKENELMLSGMMKPSEAIKIGELLPIDALFSGTYTKLKSYIDISGRLIDVTSGEILTSYSGRIKMSKNLQTLFPERGGTTAEPVTTNPTQQITNVQIVNATPEYTPTPEEICRKRLEEFKPLLGDLSTKEKVDVIANEAMKIPFDNSCDKIHYEVMYHFTRYKVQNQGYREFLLTTLSQIAQPSQDDRAINIVEYLCKDEDLSTRDWEIVLSAITRLEFYIYRFISESFKKTDTEIAKNRIDEYFQLLNAGKIGLPKPVEYDHAFYQMMHGLGKRQDLLVYTYEKYAEKLGTEKDFVVSNHLLYLNRMYEAETNQEVKEKILRWMAGYFKAHRNKKSPEQLYDFARKFRLKDNPNNNRSIDEDNKETATKYPEKHLQLFIDLCREQFTSYATETEFTSQLEDRIDFCVQHNIEVPGMIPTMDEANQILKANDLKEQLRVMKLLIQMGSKPKSLEPTLISLFDKRSLEDKDKLIEVQSYAMAILANIGTSNPKAIDYMISKVMSFNYKESDNANEAITKLGKAAVPGLIKALKATTIHDGGLRYKLIVLLGKNGKDAKPAEPTLLKIQKENSNKDIAYAIEAALQAIN